jgi:hypothetical protein
MSAAFGELEPSESDSRAFCSFLTSAPASIGRARWRFNSLAIGFDYRQHAAMCLAQGDWGVFH